jgi:hypothetical protein
MIAQGTCGYRDAVAGTKIHLRVGRDRFSSASPGPHWGSPLHGLENSTRKYTQYPQFNNL